MTVFGPEQTLSARKYISFLKILHDKFGIRWFQVFSKKAYLCALIELHHISNQFLMLFKITV